MAEKLPHPLEKMRQKCSCRFQIPFARPPPAEYVLGVRSIYWESGVDRYRSWWRLANWWKASPISDCHFLQATHRVLYVEVVPRKKSHISLSASLFSIYFRISTIKRSLLPSLHFIHHYNTRQARAFSSTRTRLADSPLLAYSIYSFSFIQRWLNLECYIVRTTATCEYKSTNLLPKRVNETIQQHPVTASTEASIEWSA